MAAICTLVIPGRLPGLNEIIASQGRPWFIGEGVKKKAARVVMIALRAQGVPVFTKPVVVKFRWVEKDKRRDLDNVTGGGTKVFMDAMKQMGVIQNDSRRWIHGIYHDTSLIDKENPRVEIQISEVEETS